MNTDPITPGTQPAGVQLAQNPTPSAAAPSSPISMGDHSGEKASAGILHFVTPKTVILMIAAWLLVIIAISAAVSSKPKPSLSKPNVPSPAGMVAPINAEEEQKSDVTLLNSRLVEYYAKFGNYPSVSQINSEQFRSGDPSFIKIGRKTFTDPLGSSINLAIKPTKGQYHYIPSPAGCNSSDILCTGYTVGATLASGQQYNLQNAE